jgi:hypothetical protein
VRDRIRTVTFGGAWMRIECEWVARVGVVQRVELRVRIDGTINGDSHVCVSFAFYSAFFRRQFLDGILDSIGFALDCGIARLWDCGVMEYGSSGNGYEYEIWVLAMDLSICRLR